MKKYDRVYVGTINKNSVDEDLRNFFDDFFKEQKQLDPDLQEIIDKNRWDLYDDK
jgi:RNA recognition motif-containing protein